MVTEELDKSKHIERYSFSKLSSWWACPYGYYQRYVLHRQGITNAFSSYGTLVHSIMERYAKGELRLKDLADTYEWEFDAAIPEKFPFNKYTDLRNAYKAQGLVFLQNFAGYDDYTILGVEEQFEIQIDDWKFNGIIDLMFKDKSGRLIIRDYKSKASFKNEEEQHKYARQLYLYSMYVKEKYGTYPDELQFLMFRKNMYPLCIKFDVTDLEESICWAKKTVSTIRSAFDYPANCEEFYSQNLCNHREYCDLKVKAKRTFHKRKK